MWNKVFPFYKVFWKFLFFSLFSMFYHLSALKCPHILYYFQLFIDKKWRQNISWASVSGTCYSTFSEIHRQEMKLQHLIGKILKYFQIFFFCAWICQEITWMQTWAWQKTTTRIFFFGQRQDKPVSFNWELTECSNNLYGFSSEPTFLQWTQYFHTRDFNNNIEGFWTLNLQNFTTYFSKIIFLWDVT